MKIKWLLLVGLVLTGTEMRRSAADDQAGAPRLQAGQKEYLTLEPILVTVRSATALPAAPGKGLRFEIQPPVKARSGAKPLPVEGANTEGTVTSRVYDLLEWFQFP